MLKNLYSNKMRFFSLVTVLLAVALWAGYYGWQKQEASQPSSMYAVLDAYGFKTPQQKQALSYLMTESGITDADKKLNAKADNKDELLAEIINFVKLTQQHFTIRIGNQERWEVETSAWMKNPQTQTRTLDALVTLNMINAVAPTLSQSDVICILGSTKNVMISRLDYAATLNREHKLSAKWLVLLAGERYVTHDKNGVSIDGSKQDLAVLGKVLGKHVDKITETDLMRVAYQNSKLFEKLPTVLIDTPKRDLPRPTTETTVIELSKWLKEHPYIKTITFVSNQPHVEYQKAIIAQVFKQQNMQLEFEVIGPEYTGAMIQNTDDKINYIVGALGSQIWAATPSVLEAIGLNVAQMNQKEDFIELYKKQPLIYNNIIHKT
jgi:hypothetical protein